MARPGRARGAPKAGGRKAGTPNKRTQELSERLEEAMGKGWCAVTAMAVMSLEADLKPEVKVRLLAEVASYQQPKPRPRVVEDPERMTLADLVIASMANVRSEIADGTVEDDSGKGDERHRVTCNPVPPSNALTSS